MAEAVLRARLGAEAAPGRAFEVTSAGTLDLEGAPADPVAAAIAAEAGYDLSGHRARPLTPDLVASADLVLAMEPRHAEEARRLAAGHPAIHLITAFLREERAAERGAGVPDPIGGGEEEFRACLRLLEGCADGVAAAVLAGRVAPPGPAPAPPAESPPEEEADLEVRFFAALAERVAAARRGRQGLTSLEFHIVDGWWGRGVPLWLALEAVGAVAARWPAGEAPRDLLGRCEAEVDRRLVEAGMAPAGSAGTAPARAPAEAPDAGLQAAAETLLRDALDRLGGGPHPIAAALRAALDDLGAAGAAPDEIGAALDRVQTRLIEAASRLVADDDLAALREEQSRRLLALGAPLSAGAFEETVGRLMGERLLDRFGLPRLGLLRLRAARGD